MPVVDQADVLVILYITTETKLYIFLRTRIQGRHRIDCDVALRPRSCRVCSHWLLQPSHISWSFYDEILWNFLKQWFIIVVLLLSSMICSKSPIVQTLIFEKQCTIRKTKNYLLFWRWCHVFIPNVYQPLPLSKNGLDTGCISVVIGG